MHMHVCVRAHMCVHVWHLNALYIHAQISREEFWGSPLPLSAFILCSRGLLANLKLGWKPSSSGDRSASASHGNGFAGTHTASYIHL